MCQARGDWNNPKIEDMELGLAHAAGVARLGRAKQGITKEENDVGVEMEFRI